MGREGGRERGGRSGREGGGRERKREVEVDRLLRKNRKRDIHVQVSNSVFYAHIHVQVSNSVFHK